MFVSNCVVDSSEVLRFPSVDPPVQQLGGKRKRKKASRARTVVELAKRVVAQEDTIASGHATSNGDRVDVAHSELNSVGAESKASDLPHGTVFSEGTKSGIAENEAVEIVKAVSKETVSGELDSFEMSNGEIGNEETGSGEMGNGEIGSEGFDGLASETGGASVKAMEDEECFHPVRCSVCNTEVGVYDKDEVYHFFNVLSSYA
jgi:hypothetical protein